MSIFACLFGLGIAIALIVGIDWTFSLFKKPAVYHTSHTPGYFIVGETGSWRPAPSSTHEAWNVAPRRDNELIYRVKYTIDKHSRRVTPVKNQSARNKHLIFFGCSFTYGVGVNDHETIPFYVAENAPDYMPYNYGFQGHSPSQMLAKLEMGIGDEIAEKDGYAIFTFMGDHISRAIGSMWLVADWGSTAPYYEWDGKSALVNKGTFETGRPFLTSLYKFIGNSNIVKHFKMDFPLRKTQKHFDYVARMIYQSKMIYRSQFPDGKFVVVIYPGTPYGNEVDQALRKLGVATINDASILDVTDPRFIIAEEDPHPSPLANKVLADHITEALLLNR